MKPSFLVIRFLVLSLLASSFFSCVNESLEIDPIEASDLIPEESELFLYLTQITGDESLSAAVTCIDFVYPFKLYVYNETSEFVYAEEITSDGRFYVVLRSIREEQSIGLSFPIQSFLEDGTEYNVENTNQLAEAIDACVGELQTQALNGVNSEFVQCGWEVRAPEGEDPDVYEQSVFEDRSGEFDFYYLDGIGAPGTFIFYHVANELRVNINIDSEDEAVATHWNREWTITSFFNGIMSIENEEDRYDLVQLCEPEVYCATLEFRACEEEAGSEQANFILEDLVYCIAVITDQSIEDNVFAFYETQEDADLQINPLPQEGYTNVTNPQEVFVRVTDSLTGEYRITPIVLLSEKCHL